MLGFGFSWYDHSYYTNRVACKESLREKGGGGHADLLWPETFQSDGSVSSGIHHFCHDRVWNSEKWPEMGRGRNLPGRF